MFSYSALDATIREFRLIELVPGSSTAALEFCLSNHSLDEPNIMYEALSYVWGDSKMTNPVRLNGHQFFITRSLYTAFLYLRHETHKRTIWVDAVCINQKDNIERCQQVRLMADIYQKATQVVVWLGEEADDSNLAIGVLEQLAAASNDAKVRSFGDRAMKAFESLFQRQWWQRIWVIQEVAVAKQVNIVCGMKSLHWNVLETGLSALDIFEGQEWVERLRGHGIGLGIVRMRNNYTRLAFLDILKMAKSHDASDPRDKVYAILGLTKLGWIMPDYSISASQVYKSLAQKLITETRNLDALGYTAGWRTAEIPSWVPDWSQRAGKSYFNQKAVSRPSHKSIYSAAGDRRAQARFSDNVQILTLKGVCCGSIETVYLPKLEDEELEDYQTLPQTKTMKLWKTAALKVPEAGCPYAGKGGRQEAYWRTLIADSNWKGYRAGPEEYNGFMAWTDRARASEIGEKKAEQLTTPKLELMNHLWIQHFTL
ncbi:HET-domain-containing protein [Stipitochalara longipes BDJ]|nr:HET-domain-containing protein [Stipitochalara longipes BDJ]